MWNYDLLGLSVRSEIRLAADESDAVASEEHCEVLRGAPTDATVFAGAELVARLGSAQDGYVVHRSGHVLVARFAGIATVVADLERQTLRASGEDEALAYVVPNAGLALYLIAGGRPVLHASAVEHGGRAHAVLGGTKAGKTTLAALLCGAGATLLTDDTLRLKVESSSVSCWGGTRSLRLRPSSADVTRCLPEATYAGISGDGRTVLRVRAPDTSRLALGSLLFPRPDPAVRQPELVPLRRSAALAGLVDATRLRGLCDRTLMADQFRALGTLARAVPAFEARMPWGPPFDSSWGQQLLRAVERAVRAG